MNPLKLVLVVLAIAPFPVWAQYVSRVPAVPDFVTVEQGQSELVDVLANDVPVLGPGLDLRRLASSQDWGNLVDGMVEFTPGPDVAPGDYTFHYTVRRANGSTAAGRVLVTVEPVRTRVVLVGRLPTTQATCEVRALVGDAVFEGCADADGVLEVEVEAVDAEQVVTVSGIGITPAGRPMRWASTLPSLSGLAQLATGGVLTYEEFGGLNLTRYTSMRTALLEQSNGGFPLGTQDDVARLDSHLDVMRFRAGELVFEAYARGLIELPIGPDTFDPYRLMFNVDLLDSISNPIVASPLGALLTAELLDEVGNDAPYPDTGEPFLAAMALTGAPGTIHRGSPGSFAVIDEGTGSGRVYQWSLTASADALVAVDGRGRRSIQAEAGRVDRVQTSLQCDSGGSVQFEIELQTRLTSLRRVVEGPASDIVLLEHERVAVNAGQAPPGCTSPLFETVRYVFPLVAYGAEQVEPFAALPGGRWQLDLPAADPSESPPANLGQVDATLDFTTQALDASGYAPTFDAQLTPEGRLRVRLVSLTQPARVVEFARLRRDPIGVEQWLGIYDQEGGGAHGAIPAMAAQVNIEPGELLADDLVGFWHQGSVLANRGRADSGSYRGLARELRGGSPREGSVWEVNFAGNLVTHTPFAWTFDGERMVASTYTSRQGGAAAAQCPHPDPADCYISAQRTWIPGRLGVVDGELRMVMREQVRFGNPVDDSLRSAGERMMFYDTRPGPPQP